MDTFGTGSLSDDVLRAWLILNVDFRPSAIIETLNLRRPVYEKTAAYGHFGRNIFPWERLDGDTIRLMRTMLK